MKPLLLTLLTLLLLGPVAEADLKRSLPEKQPVTLEQSVWICNSKSAYAYHSTKTCRGLGRCKSEIISVKLSAARNQGRSACKICY